MNPNPQLAPDEQRALEQTTSPRGVSSAGLSAESVADREAFLQLGQLLEHAAGDFDEGAFLRKLQSGIQTSTVAPLVPPSVRSTVPRPARRGSELWIALSLAAAVMFVIGASVWFTQGTTPLVTPQPPVVKENIPAIVKQTPAAPKSLAPQAPPKNVVVVAPSANSDWSDPLDERLAEMRNEVRAAARPYLMDTSLRMISEQVRELQDELDAGTL